MLGFSLQKLIVLAAVIAIAWYGFKWLSRYQQVQKDKKRETERLNRKRKPASQDLEACTRCGAFVPAGSTHDCA